MKKKTPIPSIEPPSLCPVIDIREGKTLLPKEEIIPTTEWEQFEEALIIGLTSTQGNIEIVMETLKKTFKITKL